MDCEMATQNSKLGSAQGAWLPYQIEMETELLHCFSMDEKLRLKYVIEDNVVRITLDGNTFCSVPYTFDESTGETFLNIPTANIDQATSAFPQTDPLIMPGPPDKTPAKSISLVQASHSWLQEGCLVDNVWRRLFDDHLEQVPAPPLATQPIGLETGVVNPTTQDLNQAPKIDSASLSSFDFSGDDSGYGSMLQAQDAQPTDDVWSLFDDQFEQVLIQPLTTQPIDPETGIVNPTTQDLNQAPKIDSASLSSFDFSGDDSGYGSMLQAQDAQPPEVKAHDMPTQFIPSEENNGRVAPQIGELPFLEWGLSYGSLDGVSGDLQPKTLGQEVHPTAQHLNLGHHNSLKAQPHLTIQSEENNGRVSPQIGEFPFLEWGFSYGSLDGVSGDLQPKTLGQEVRPTAQHLNLGDHNIPKAQPHLQQNCSTFDPHFCGPADGVPGDDLFEVFGDGQVIMSDLPAASQPQQNGPIRHGEESQQPSHNAFNHLAPVDDEDLERGPREDSKRREKNPIESTSHLGYDFPMSELDANPTISQYPLNSVNEPGDLEETGTPETHQAARRAQAAYPEVMAKGNSARDKYVFRFEGDDDAANAYLNRPRLPPGIAPAHDPSIAEVVKDKEKYITDLFHAITNLRTHRRAKPADLKLIDPNIPGSKVDFTRIEATCRRMFKLLMVHCHVGYSGPDWNKKSKFVPKPPNGWSDEKATCAERINKVIEILKEDKMVCRDILGDDSKIKQLLALPYVYAQRKIQDGKSNDKRRETAQAQGSQGSQFGRSRSRQPSLRRTVLSMASGAPSRGATPIQVSQHETGTKRSREDDDDKENNPSAGTTKRLRL